MVQGSLRPLDRSVSGRDITADNAEISVVAVHIQAMPMLLSPGRKIYANARGAHPGCSHGTSNHERRSWKLMVRDKKGTIPCSNFKFAGTPRVQLVGERMTVACAMFSEEVLLLGVNAHWSRELRLRLSRTVRRTFT